MDKKRNQVLNERYELTLKQENQPIKITKNLKKIEEDFDLTFKYKKVLKIEKQWVFIIYFVQYQNKEIEVISKIGAMTSFKERVIKAIRNNKNEV